MKKIRQIDYSPDADAVGSDPWWQAKAKNPEANLFSAFQSAWNNQSLRRSAFGRFYRLYSFYDATGMANSIAMQAQQAGFARAAMAARVSYNAVFACVETATNRIAKVRPRMQFLTERGRLSQMRKSQSLTQFFDGAFHEGEFYDTGAAIFRDGAIWGSGIGNVYINADGKLALDQVPNHEIVVDDSDGLYGKPSTIYRYRLMDKAECEAMYAVNQEGKVDDAKARTIRDSGMPITGDFGDTLDKVVVVEGYRLPFGVFKGSHIVAVEKGTLIHEEWNCAISPYVKFDWIRRPIGWWGIGVTESILGIQLELNSLSQRIQKATYYAAAPRMLRKRDSMVEDTKLTNQLDISIIDYDTTAPQIVVSPCMPPEVYAQVQQHWDKAFDTVGISQLSASGRKPPGLDAAVALLEQQDIESDRFSTVQQNYDRFFQNVTKVGIYLCKRSKDEGVDVTSRAPSGGYYDKVPWSKVGLPEDEYVIKMFPSNLLPTQPSARIQKVQEYVQAGWLDRRFGMALAEFPDVAKATTLERSSLDAAMDVVESAAFDGKVKPISPYQDVALVISLAQAETLRGECEDYPAQNMRALAAIIEDAKAIQTKIAAGQATAAAPTPLSAALTQPAAATPMAVPEALPASPLLPMGAV